MSALLPKLSSSRRRQIILGFVFLVLCFSLQIFFFGRQRRTDAGDFELPLHTKQAADLRFNFVIKLLTYNRLHSLNRCLDSLVAADYEGYHVKLHIFIDHFPLTDEYSPSIDIKLKEAHQILDIVDRFNWPHGTKEIHYRTQNAGLQGQWLEAWWPASDHEFAFVVEDDMILSSIYFKYLRRIIETYYLDPANYDPSIYGISLQRPRFVPGKHGNPLLVDNATNLFLYQLVGTWGQLLFPSTWKEFRIWYDTHKSKNLKPFLDGMKTTGWYHRSKEKIWTPWFIKFVHSKGYFNLYTHFKNEQALSASHRDIGVNTKTEAGPDSILIGNERLLGRNLWAMKSTKYLKRYNYCFQEVIQNRLMKRRRDIKKVVPSLQTNNTVILVNAIGYTEVVIKNWLCQFSRFRLRNYIILLNDLMLEKDLLLKGHAVMHLDLNEDESDKMPLDGCHKCDISIKRTLISAKAITWILEIGYDVWVTNADILWISNPLSGVRVGDTDVLGFIDAKGISAELLYSRSSDSTKSFWRAIHIDVLRQIESQTDNPLNASLAEITLKYNIKLEPLPATHVANVFEYKNNIPDTQKGDYLLLTGIENSDACMRLLKSFGFWWLDDELACTSIYC